MLFIAFAASALLPVLTLCAPSHQEHTPLPPPLEDHHLHNLTSRTHADTSPHPSGLDQGSDPHSQGRALSRQALPLPPSGQVPAGVPAAIPQVLPDEVNAMKPLMMAYFADWAPREDIDFSRFDWIDYAFDVVSQDSSLNWDDAMNGSKQLQKLVADAHGGGTKVKLSIGGWTGSKDFSTAVSTPEKRQTFANNVEKLYKDYNLDGIDIDWEYPGQSGDGANGVSPNDTQNMLSFFKLLREALPPTARITAAVQDQPFAGADGQPIHDASGFAEVLDWVLMMDYDTYETTTPPGPNAPLYNGCGKSREPSQNAAAGVNAWTAAGFPANKLVLGVPSYGYITKSSETTLQARSLPPTRHSPRRLSRRNTALPEDDSGQIQFRSLVRQGILVQGGDGSFVGSGGFERGWDSCSATPFLHNPQSGQLIPYDDPQSLALKAAFVRKMGMAGVNLFDIHGDTDAWDLTDSLRKNLVVPAV